MKTGIPFLLASLLCLALRLSALETGSIEGLVKDEELDFPCAGAYVSVKAMEGFGFYENAAITDIKGKYRIQSIPEGRYKVRCLAPSVYVYHAERIIYVKHDGVLKVDFKCFRLVCREFLKGIYTPCRPGNFFINLFRGLPNETAWVSVEISKERKITRIYIDQSSGKSNFDKEALDSFKSVKLNPKDIRDFPDDLFPLTLHYFVDWYRSQIAMQGMNEKRWMIEF